MTVAFGCLVLLHGIAFVFFKRSASKKMWWLKVDGKGLGWKVGAMEVPLLFDWKVKVWWLVREEKIDASRYNIFA